MEIREVLARELVSFVSGGVCIPFRSRSRVVDASLNGEMYLNVITGIRVWKSS